MTTHEDRFRDDVPEFVLGVLDGRSRSALLEHLESCDECATDVESLALASDALMHVPASVEPPVGFESRTLERIGGEGARRPRRRRPMMMAAAAIVAAVALGWGVGHAVDSSTPGAPVRQAAFEQRPLVDGSSNVGTVYTYSGRPGWMFVSVDLAHGPSTVRCVVVTTLGVRRAIGNFSLRDGQGSWGTPLPVASASVRSVDLTTLSGTLVASARTVGSSPAYVTK